MFGTSILINGASRYAHVFVVATYAWTLEAIFMLATPGLSPSRQRLWGVVLSTAAVFCIAARPADGAFVGLGAAVLFLYVLARRRVGWRGFAAAVAAFAFWAGLMLVILRLQLGTWFTTGYSLNALLRPWNVIKYSWPEPNQWKYGLPLATGSYCWWPSSMAVGLAGLAMLRGRATGLATAFVLGCVPFVVYSWYLDFGRGYDWGYGPRYMMVLLVPMAVGSAVALAPLTVAARTQSVAGSALARGGPLALAVLAIASCWIRIVPLLWPPMADHVRRHSSLERAIEDAHLTNAIVVATTGTTGFTNIDLTRNLPLDLYPDQDVIIGVDRERSPHEAVECLRAAFPERRVYLASGIDPVSLTSSPY